MTVPYDMSGSKAAQRAFATSFMYQILSVVPLPPCFHSLRQGCKSADEKG